MVRNTYAFGDNKTDGIPCPALAAGLKPYNGGVTSRMAEKYDEVARLSEGRSDGVTDADKAESYWSEAIEGIRRDINVEEKKVESARDSDKLDFQRRMLAVGEKVERKQFAD